MSVSVPQFQLFFLAFTRIMAVIIHIPVLGGQIIPNQVRIGLGILLTLFLFPWQTLPPADAIMEFGPFALAIGKEILIGTVAGYAADLVFGIIQMAAEAMGFGSGFSSDRVFNPAMGNSGSAYDQVVILSATLYFLIIDGHHLVLRALQGLFQTVPIQGTISFADPTLLLQMTSQMIKAGIQLALPILAALLLTDLSLGLLARITPQLQVYFLGLPLKIGVSLVAMGLMLVILLPAFGNLYKEIGTNMLALVQK